jgi:putative transcriptional regulator
LELLSAAFCLIKNILAMENKLKELRMQGKVSQSALADALSVSRQTINSIENGKFDPSLTLAMKLTRFFKVSLDEIFIYKD